MVKFIPVFRGSLLRSSCKEEYTDWLFNTNQIVSPENTYTGNSTQTEEVAFRNLYAYTRVCVCNNNQQKKSLYI